MEVPDALGEMVLEQPDVEELPEPRHQRAVEPDPEGNEKEARDDEGASDDGQPEDPGAARGRGRHRPNLPLRDPGRGAPFTE